ncbi:ATP-binding protein [Desulfoluna sp.]|uniref:AAA family ATPase n=1 Tax=Desulfoluna sp. TaxID=2045199 RepID=UPI0026355DD1|nr:ATP-binding protein [Desulfoluna sp.]
MLKRLEMTNVGPAPSMELELAPRLNLLTGDNGLGKSFLFDITWWALTRKWPVEVNANLTAGKKGLPSAPGEATIRFSFTGKVKEEQYESSYTRKDQAWTGRPGRPVNPELVLYAMADGSFAVWDPARNYWRTQNGVDVQERRPAYVFNPSEIWDGLKGEDGKPLCNGLVQDWAGWQKENGEAFHSLKSVLETLSPSEAEPITPGKLTRISLDDARDIPTLAMPYGQDVPVLHASSGMRRIIALAYVLVWAWEEHRKASELLTDFTTHQVIFLVDEIESHLHPKWQLKIIRSLLEVMKSLAPTAEVQLLVSTHSPLVLASVESYFDENKDAWFDLDYDPKAETGVTLNRRPFEPQGDASNWLTGDAFDLPSARNPEYAQLMEEAAELLDDSNATEERVVEMHQRLSAALNPKDSFLFRWRGICSKRGLLS